VEFVTDYSVRAGNQLVRDWGALFGQLFVKYRDGYVITANAEDKSCGCNPVPQSYPQPWFDRIVKDTGDHYLVREDGAALKRQGNLAPVNKKDLRAMQ
jgi:hypothetical protein